MDPTVKSWIDELTYPVSNTSGVTSIQEIFKRDPFVCFLILKKISDTEADGGSPTKTQIHKAVQNSSPGSETLDFHMKYMESMGYIKDNPERYRESGEVLEKHAYELTDRGREACNALRDSYPQWRDRFPIKTQED